MIKSVYWFVRAAVTKHHKVDGSKSRNLLSHSSEARTVKLKSQQDQFLLRVIREGLLTGLSPWLMDGHLLYVSAQHLPCVHVCLQISSLYKDTCHVD